MPAMLAIGLGTACVIAAVLLFVTGYTAAGVVAAIAGVAFDLLFAKALMDARKHKASHDGSAAIAHAGPSQARDARSGGGARSALRGER
jgi:hypothetical protein